MGFRMYVSKAEDKENWDNCYGKCYGYNHGVHLYSLDYLCSINAFEDWDTCDLWNTRDPGDMSEYFSAAQATDAIYLTEEQFRRFIPLYLSDQIAVYGNCCSTFFVPENETLIKIEWG